MSLQIKTIEQNGSKGWQKFSLFITENSTDVTTNKSSISYSFQVSPVRYSVWVGWGSLISYSVSVAGHTKTGTIPSYDGTSTITLATDTFDVDHTADGNKEIGFSFSVEDGTSVSYTCGNAYREGIMALTYIPRKTNFSVTSVSVNGLGKVQRFTDIVPASPTFTHSLKLTIGDNFTKYIDGRTGEWSDTEIKFGTILNDANKMDLFFDAKKSLYSVFSGNSVIGDIVLTTYNGDNKLGDSSAKFYIVLGADCLPRIKSATVYDENESTYALTGDRERFIAYESSCKLTLNFSPSDIEDTATTIASLKINGVEYEGGITSITTNIGVLTNDSIKIDMVNSRGIPNTVMIKINKWVPYTPISGNVWIGRGSQTSMSETGIITSAYASFYSFYYNGSFDSNDTIKNVFSFKWRYKKRNDTEYSEWYTLSASDIVIENGQAHNVSPLPYLKDNNGNTINFEYHTYYDLEFIMSDKLTNQYITSELASASPVYSWNEFGVRITDSFVLGGESAQGHMSYYGCPIVVKEETSTDDENIVVAKKLLDSQNHFVNNDYENNYDNLPGKLFLDATTLITKQNNKWKVPTCWADIMYPIGSVYINVKSIDPNLFFGGTWKAIEEVFLYGAGQRHPVGSTGGEESTTLTIANIPNHYHTFPVGTNATVSGDYDRASSGFAGGTPKDLHTSSTGGSEPHNNMPPFRAVCVWERIA